MAEPIAGSLLQSPRAPLPPSAHRRPRRRRRHRLCARGGCGPRNSLDGFDVVVQKTAECTVTGDFSRQCEDVAVLAQTTLEARWYVEVADDDASVTVTTNEGRTLPGLRFNNDGSVISVDGCFASRRLCNNFHRNSKCCLRYR